MLSYEKSAVPRETFGEGKAKITGQRLDALNATKVLLITDAVLVKIGTADVIINSIKEAGIDVVVYDKVEPDTADWNVHDCIKLLRDNECDAIVALGGGSVLDCAKIVGILAPLDEEKPSMLDYCIKPDTKMKSTYTRNGVVAIYIPTTGGTGAESTIGAMVNETTHGVKVQILNEHELPDLVIIDPELTYTTPLGLTAVCGLDALSHCAEHLVGASQFDFQDDILFDCITRIWRWLPIVMKDLNHKEGRAQLAWAAHQALCNGGNGNGHGVAHGIGGTYHEYHLVHGHCCLMVLPTVIRWHADTRAKQIRRLAECFGLPYAESDDNQTVANRVAEAVVEYSKSVGYYPLQETFKKKGIKDTKDEFIKKTIEPARADAITAAWTPAIHIGDENLIKVLSAIWDEK